MRTDSAKAYNMDKPLFGIFVDGNSQHCYAGGSSRTPSVKEGREPWKKYTADFGLDLK